MWKQGVKTGYRFMWKQGVKTGYTFRKEGYIFMWKQGIQSCLYVETGCSDLCDVIH